MNNNELNSKPFVSMCTPTFNRRPFINAMIKCFEHQDYPKDRMEWIIIDDGTDKIGELVSHIKEVKYYSYERIMPLGEKRNLLHKKSTGDILVYMDDDDYYPPDRVSHAVYTLMNNPKALCAGSSEMYIYYKDLNKMYQFGPFGENHATAGTFAFKRELIKDNLYKDDVCLCEERDFLKNFTVPFVQLDPMKTILVISHLHNTVDKKQLLIRADPNFIKESTKTVDMFIKDADMKHFYMEEIEDLLVNYHNGKREKKPGLIEQTEAIIKENELLLQKKLERITEDSKKDNIKVQELLGRYTNNLNKTAILFNNNNQITNITISKLIKIVNIQMKQIETLTQELNKYTNL